MIHVRTVIATLNIEVTLFRLKEGTKMKVIKKINNNAAICLDGNGNELVALGVGIGFPKCPYDLTDLSIIQSTYYDVNVMWYDYLNSIPDKVLELSVKIIDLFRSRSAEPVSSNLLFSLADHINFAIERYQKNMYVNSPLQYDVQNLYEIEYEISLQALKLINTELGIRLPRAEASYITMHFVQAQSTAVSNNKQSYVDQTIFSISEIISETFDMHLNKSSFNFSRFATHLQYLIKRNEKGDSISSENLRMYETMIKEYPQTFLCVSKINEYLRYELTMELNKEELLYLILHINRLCVREDCYRKGITPED